MQSYIDLFFHANIVAAYPLVRGRHINAENIKNFKPNILDDTVKMMKDLSDSESVVLLLF